MPSLLNTAKKASLGLSLITCALLSGCNDGSVNEVSLQSVSYLNVEPERIVLTTTLPGRVSALVESEIRPQVEGIIKKRLFKEGSNVEAGQVLYQIDDDRYEAAYHAALATLEEAKSKVSAIALQERRYRILSKNNAISKQDLDNAVSNLGQARAQVLKAEADVESAKINLDYCQIKAPVSGRISASSVTEGALVTANQTDALARILMIDKVYVDITRSSQDILALRRSLTEGRLAHNENSLRLGLILEDGTPYTRLISADGKKPQVFGNFVFSDIFVGANTGTVTVRALFDNPDHLLMPGMYVTAVMTEGTLNEAITVPQGAVLFNSEGKHIVFVLEEDPSDPKTFTVTTKQIEILRPYSNRYIISEGLEPHDKVVVAGLQKISQGDKVEAIDITPKDRVKTEISTDSAEQS